MAVAIATKPVVLCTFSDINEDWCAHCLGHVGVWEVFKRGNAHDYRD